MYSDDVEVKEKEEFEDVIEGVEFEDVEDVIQGVEIEKVSRLEFNPVNAIGSVYTDEDIDTEYTDEEQETEVFGDTFNKDIECYLLQRFKSKKDVHTYQHCPVTQDRLAYYSCVMGGMILDDQFNHALNHHSYQRILSHSNNNGKRKHEEVEVEDSDENCELNRIRQIEINQPLIPKTSIKDEIWNGTCTLCNSFTTEITLNGCATKYIQEMKYMNITLQITSIKHHKALLRYLHLSFVLFEIECEEFEHPAFIALMNASKSNLARVLCNVLRVESSGMDSILTIQHNIFLRNTSSSVNSLDLSHTMNYAVYFLINLCRETINPRPRLKSNLLSQFIIPDTIYDLTGINLIRMKSNLYQYQKKAVAWMLEKEGVILTENGLAEMDTEPLDILHSTRFGIHLWKSIGKWSLVHLKSSIVCRGGILADEV